MKKLKRILVFTITAFCCALLYTGCTFDAPVSDSGTCGSNLQWTLDYETGVLTITGSGAMMDFGDYNDYNAVPWAYRGRFYDHRPYSKILLSDGITTIGKKAFIGSGELLSVSIPSSVTSIGESAFSSCYILPSIYIPSSVTSIGDEAFMIIILIK